MTAPRISVIVATRNARETLQRCLDSVAAQTHPHRELLVCDAASTDGTAALLADNAGRVTWWISEPDRGVYDAWNKALARATGDWVCFLGADDTLRDDGVLARMAAALAALPPEIGLAYGRVVRVDAAGAQRGELGEPWERARVDFLERMTIPHPGLMHRRALFDRYGPFDPSFRIAGDYEWLLRVLPAGAARFVPEVTVVAMREGGLSSRPAAAFRLHRETWRAQRRHGRRLPPAALARALLRSGARLALTRLLGERLVSRLRGDRTL